MTLRASPGCVNMRSRPDKNHMHVQRWQARSIQPLFGKVNREEQRQDLRERRKSSLQRLLHIYIMPIQLAKVGEPPPPPPPPPGVEFVGSQKKYPERRQSHQLCLLCTLWLSVGEGRFLYFFLYGCSNFRAPHHHPLAPQKERLAERLGTRCKFNSIWPTTQGECNQKLY